MRRDLPALADREYDLVVVGGGIYGVCAAWDATLRGLSVALVERRDFGSGTTANSLKMVHGGIRYLQHADIYRVRESSRERSALLRIAPHLVRPLPIVIPTYGHGLRGKEILAAGMTLYDLLTFDRNRGLRDPDRRIPGHRLISRDECLSLFRDLDSRRLTGAAVFQDGQMYSSPRLTLSFLKSAVEGGAVAANYVEATGFARQGTVIGGVEARDVLTGDTFTLHGKIVLNAAGPWAEHILQRDLALQLKPPGLYSRDACFVVGRPWVNSYALAVTGPTRDPDAIVSRKARHLFIVPWHEYTLVGVWHVVYEGDPDRFSFTDEDLQAFINEVNVAYPPLALTLDDVSFRHAGLVLFGQNEPGAKDLSFGKRSRIIDHSATHGLDGLITVIGVRSTTARGIADRAIRLAFRKLGRRAPRCMTETTPIHGGRIETLGELAASALAVRPDGVAEQVIRGLVQNHGSEYRRVLERVRENPDFAGTVGDSKVLKAEVVHAVREEMAQRLGDVVFRRTDLGTGGHPGEEEIAACAALMAVELGWSPDRIEAEIEEVNCAFPHLPRAGVSRAAG